MSRRNISKKRFPETDSVYNSYLVSLLITRILKSGKKTIAKKIVYDAFEIIKTKTNDDPLKVFENAIRKASPVVEVKARRIGGSTYQVPIEIRAYRGTNISLKWITEFARQRSGKSMAMKLSNEILDAAKETGNSVRRKEQTHKMDMGNARYFEAKRQFMDALEVIGFYDIN